MSNDESGACFDGPTDHRSNYVNKLPDHCGNCFVCDAHVGESKFCHECQRYVCDDCAGGNEPNKHTEHQPMYAPKGD